MSEYTKTALVLGAGGFIGSHMVKRLREEGYWVRGVDLKKPEFSETEANEFIQGDLRDVDFVRRCIRFTGYLGNFYQQIVDKFAEPFDEIYQFAADMGGAGFVFTGENDADIMHNSCQINLNVLEEQRKFNELKGCNITKIFYSGSACMYPEHNQLDPDNPDCREESAYPANPDSCLHPDTEVLTEGGFKSIVELSLTDKVATLNDEGYLEYHYPIEKQELNFSGKLIDIKTKYLSCKITPDHNIVECNANGNDLKNTNADSFVNRNSIVKGYFKRNCNWKGNLINEKVIVESTSYSTFNFQSTKIENRKKNGYEFKLNDYLELISWFVTEGNCGFYKNKDYIVQIRQTKQPNLNNIIDLCKRMNIKTYIPKDNGRVIIYSKVLYEHFKDFGVGSENKKLPDWILKLPKEQLKIVFDTMMLGDGTSSKGKYCYSTISPRLRDQFIEICLKIGYASSVNTKLYSDKKPIYHIGISKQHLVHKVTNDNIKYFEYDGKVYDITIPNHRFYIRYNGKHMWTGNCYGWEKLFSEILYFAYHRNYNIPVRVARYHNIFGPEGTWEGGREKAPAAICRKVAYLPEEGGAIEVWGDGLQTRSFLFIDECIEATRRLMDSDFIGPVNIGSEEMVTINQLVDTAAKVAGKKVHKIHKLDAPLGVRGRNSNNDLIREKLCWDYFQTLEEGIAKTYNWIKEQIEKNKNA